MKILSKVTPLNIETEKERFLQDPSYNPQFEYRVQTPIEELHAWGKPKKAIADFFMTHQTKLQQEISTQDSSFLTQHEITQAALQLFKELEIDQPLKIEFSTTMLAKCRLYDQKLVFKSPILYHQHELAGVLNHEIQTHFLRKINNSQQPWATSTRPDPVFRATEEGLAILHTYLGSGERSMFNTFTAYYGLYLAHTRSFSESYQALLEVGIEPERAWRLVVRGKRGITDTSQPTGGLSKDLTYLEGAIHVWRWLNNPANDPHDLYLGRIGIPELADRKAEARTDHLMFPTFHKDINQYRQHIREIGQTSFLAEVPL